jgi:hypothetical protein
MSVAAQTVLNQIFMLPAGTGIKAAPGEQTSIERSAKIAMLRNLLISVGVPQTQVLQWVVAMVMLETGWLTNTGTREDNNLSGITWDPRYFPLSMRGTPRPKSEGGYYVRYPTVNDWARSYMTYLTKKAAPIQASSLEDFVHRLKLNGYMRAPENIYLNIMRGVVAKLQFNDVLAQDRREIAAQEDPNNPLNWWKRQNIWIKGGTILAAIVVVKKILD